MLEPRVEAEPTAVQLLSEAIKEHQESCATFSVSAGGLAAPSVSYQQSQGANPMLRVQTVCGRDSPFQYPIQSNRSTGWSFLTWLKPKGRAARVLGQRTSCFWGSSPYRCYFSVYFQTGDVCISILHPPVDDPQSGELPSERWNPTQNVRYGQGWGE